MSSVLSKWTQAVYDHCRLNQCGVTPKEAIAMFGNPPSRSSSASILCSAMANGWFRREEWLEEGATAMVYRSRYWAIDKQPAAVRPVNRTKSYFDGITRCRSVFELGETN